MSSVAPYMFEIPALQGWEKSTQEPSELSDKVKLPVVLRVPLRVFQGQGMIIMVDKPIEVTIYEGDDLFSAESESLHIYATGGNIDEAISDFIEQIIYFYRYYTALGENEVVGEAARLRGLYCSQFHEQIADVA